MNLNLNLKLRKGLTHSDSDSELRKGLTRSDFHKSYDQHMTSNYVNVSRGCQCRYHDFHPNNDHDLIYHQWQRHKDFDADDLAGS